MLRNDVLNRMCEVLVCDGGGPSLAGLKRVASTRLRLSGFRLCASPLASETSRWHIDKQKALAEFDAFS